MSANVLRAGGQPFPLFCVECANGWIISLQYVNTKELFGYSGWPILPVSGRVGSCFFLCIAKGRVRPPSFHYLPLLKSKTILEFAEAAFEFPLLLGFFAGIEEGSARCEGSGHAERVLRAGKGHVIRRWDPWLG